MRPSTLWLAVVSERWDGDVPGLVTCIDQVQLWKNSSEHLVVLEITAGNEPLLHLCSRRLLLRCALAADGIRFESGGRLFVDLVANTYVWKRHDNAPIVASTLDALLAQMRGEHNESVSQAQHYLAWRRAPWPSLATDAIQCLAQAPEPDRDPTDAAWLIHLVVHPHALPLLRWVSFVELAEATDGVGSDEGVVSLLPDGQYLVETWDGNAQRVATLRDALAVLFQSS